MAKAIANEPAGSLAPTSEWQLRRLVLGIPVLALSGYSSQTYVDVVTRHADRSGRPPILIYAGDLDPSGEDIDRDFEKRTGCFEEKVKIALNWDQVEQYQLPPNAGKATDSRAAGFVQRHGELIQVELEARDLLTSALVTDAIDRFWDTSAFEAAKVRELAGREALATAAEAMP